MRGAGFNGLRPWQQIFIVHAPHSDVMSVQMPTYTDDRLHDAEYRRLMRQLADDYTLAAPPTKSLFPQQIHVEGRKRADIEWDEMHDTRTRWPELRALEEEYRDAWDDLVEVKPDLADRYDTPEDCAWDRYKEEVRARHQMAQRDHELQVDATQP